MSIVKVNKKMCSTCIFSGNSFTTPEHFDHLEQAWYEGKIATCHHDLAIHGADKSEILCRGYYERIKQKKYPTSHLVQICIELWDFVDFVDIPDNDPRIDEYIVRYLDNY